MAEPVPATSDNTPKRLDLMTRLAMFEAWKERCVWCHRPLFFNLMEVEHLLPKSLTGLKRSEVLMLHGKDEDWDLDALENLAPSCGPCNEGKGPKLPPLAPGITLLLQEAEQMAPRIRDDAARFRKKRGLQRALTIVMGAVQSGDVEATEQLRVAIDEIGAAVEEVTLNRPERLRSAIDAISDAAASIAFEEDGFDYPVATHRTGGAAQGPTPGSILSVSEVSGDFTVRTDVVPRDDDALERYRPLLRLLPTDDDAGRKATVRLERALRLGHPVVIDEGMDLVLDQLPPGLGQYVGQRLSGGRLSVTPAEGVVRPMPDWHARLRAVPADGGQKREVRMLLRHAPEAPDGWDAALTGTKAGMTATFMARAVDGRGQMGWSFQHARDDSSIREQLSVLRFLDALSSGATLEAEDTGPSKRPFHEMRVAQTVVGPEAKALLAFLEDVRTIEVWSRQELRLPDKISVNQAQVVATIATVIRDGGRTINWSASTARVRAEALEELRSGGVVAINHVVSAEVLGQHVDLGRRQLDLPGYQLTSAEPVADNPGYVDVCLVPSDAAAAEAKEHLIRPKSKRPPDPPNRHRSKANSRRKRRR